MRTKKEWPTYEEAKYLIQRRDIVSREDYWRWYDEKKPVYLPKYPYRVFDDWVSWSDFLNTNNSFAQINNVNANAKRYWDAVRYVHTFNIQTAKEYKKLHKEGKLIDVPYCPDAFYHEWTGWNDYLGKSVTSVIDSSQNQKPIWAVIHIAGEPPNVVWFLKVGSSGELNEKAKDGWTVLKRYWYEEQLVDDVWSIIDNNSAMQYDKEQRLCGNVNQLLWELGNVLAFAR